MAKRKSPADKAPRLGTRMRGALEEAYGIRGIKLEGLTPSYSLKAKRDVVIATNIGFLHFIHAESDPAVININYRPTVPEADESLLGIDCEVLLTNRRLELRSVRAEGVTTTPAQREELARCIRNYLQFPRTIGPYTTVSHRIVTPQDLVPGNEMRLRNWHRLLARYADARYHSLGHARRVVMARLESRGACTVSELLSIATDEAPSGLLVAAAIEHVAYGHCDSDLDVNVFGGNTRFSLKERR